MKNEITLAHLRIAFRAGVLLQANHDFQMYGATTIVTQHLPDRQVDNHLKDIYELYKVIHLETENE